MLGYVSYIESIKADGVLTKDFALGFLRQRSNPLFEILDYPEVSVDIRSILVIEAIEPGREPVGSRFQDRAFGAEEGNMAGNKRFL